ncbi:MAG: winged helix-turn-helix transcriptional regulator [Actinomycetes bacterium]
MRSYGQYCPLARASELLATRWTLIVVRNLLLGCRTLQEIEDGAPGIPPALLRERLQQLELAGVVSRRPKPTGRGSEWELTEAGRRLAPVCDAMANWGMEWLQLGPQHHDPYVVLWSICRVMPPSALPAHRLVARFELAGSDPPRLWLLTDSRTAEICVKPPGFGEDLVVRTDPVTLLDWHLGRLSLGRAMHARRATVQGSSEAVRILAGWGGLGVRHGRGPEDTAAG